MTGVGCTRPSMTGSYQVVAGQDVGVVNRLTWIPAELPTHRLHFWEPVIDGRPLRQLLRDAPSDGTVSWAVEDMAPVLVHDWPGGLPDDVVVLLGERPTDLASGRLPLFVCPVCGDVGCGAMTAAVEWTTDTVTWRNLGWDGNNNIDDHEHAPVGPFVFDRMQYEAALRRFIATFTQIRASLPAPSAPPTHGVGARRWWRPFS